MRPWVKINGNKLTHEAKGYVCMNICMLNVVKGGFRLVFMLSTITAYRRTLKSASNRRRKANELFFFLNIYIIYSYPTNWKEKQTSDGSAHRPVSFLSSRTPLSIVDDKNNGKLSHVRVTLLSWECSCRDIYTWVGYSLLLITLGLRYKMTSWYWAVTSSPGHPLFSVKHWKAGNGPGDKASWTVQHNTWGIQLRRTIPITLPLIWKLRGGLIKFFE